MKDRRIINIHVNSNKNISYKSDHNKNKKSQITPLICS